MKPQIEYHFAVQAHGGGWTEHYESHKPGTTFDQVKANGWDWVDKFTPLRLRWTSWAWPGGYPIYYLVRDMCVLCHECANAELDRTLDKDDDQFYIVDMDINDEDQHLHCDHCNAHIEPSCGFEEKHDEE